MDDADEPLVDDATFRLLREDLGSAEALVEVFDAFLDEVPALLAELRGAVGAGDVARAQRLAHSLKSSAATFGVTKLAALSARLERAAKEAPAGLPALVEALAPEWSRAGPALEARRRALA